MEKSRKKEILSWVRPIVIAIIIAIVCRQFLISPITVRGESMEPTYVDNNKVLIIKKSSIERFDIIVFDAPDSDENYIKRVIGLPGDHVAMKDDVLYINGKAYEEPYLDTMKADLLEGNFTYDFTLEEVTDEKVVPAGSYFVLGDNRLKSSDSREYGFIAKGTVKGEVKIKFFPISLAK
ncbi:signal peptidase I [Viridibacillus sp. YIM B01967]|uniref:Signal peptidase I n=1 Tax=Viridibacillus soli TaxID=2798301 RepID=A0ABS1H5E2_9BACL|nr:signal peptidase I [Viridibacillus soli]MBK3494638.1 signal peptidase I [Viridibacillus soli]